ncbi:hypothetical protein [Hydrogenophaga sp. 2FB]|uniref:hypothetical protein n=1 Tax=Hydrogenophaga sp. 2FB TaxID=2502187 RepID=UPI0010F74071|nr:hypothetical protein [Hydrogenophaga sp. 2FB]
MTPDVNPSLLSTIPSRPESRAEPQKPDSAPTEVVNMVAALPQIEAEEKAVVKVIHRVDELTRELKDLDEKLAGNLSNFSRAEVEGMTQRAFILEQELETLKNPEQARADGPGL